MKKTKAKQPKKPSEMTTKEWEKLPLPVQQADVVGSVHQNLYNFFEILNVQSDWKQEASGTMQLVSIVTVRPKPIAQWHGK